MSRALPFACLLGLLALVAWQLVALVAPPGAVERVPLFVPSSLGTQGRPAPACPAVPPPDAAAAALQDLPLQALLDALRGSPAAARPPVTAALEELDRQQRAIYDLRNRRHAWNVAAMEASAALANALDPAQLRWLLDNRDRVQELRLGPPPSPSASP